MTNLDEAQKKVVSGWISEGLKLSDIQSKLSSELGINLTYMEVRLLVDDLKLVPKDVEPPKAMDLTAVPPTGGQAPASQPAGKGGAPQPTQEGAPAPGRVSVSVDNLARPGTVVSGNVTFSDGNSAEWYLDEMGRLGLMPKREGYRPSQQDVIAFQTELQNELARMGM